MKGIDGNHFHTLHGHSLLNVVLIDILDNHGRLLWRGDLGLDVVFDGFEELADHGCCLSTAGNPLIGLAFIEHGEGVTRILLRQESGKPGQTLILVFRPYGLFGKRDA